MTVLKPLFAALATLMLAASLAGCAVYVGGPGYWHHDRGYYWH